MLDIIVISFTFLAMAFLGSFLTIILFECLAILLAIQKSKPMYHAEKYYRRGNDPVPQNGSKEWWINNELPA